MFERSRVSFRMHILPGALSNVEGALRAQLNQSILTYVPALDGVPVSYADLRIMKPLGLICDEQPQIHLPVEAVVLVFRPRVGTVLEGIVTRSSRDVLSALVLNIFTASIQLREGTPVANGHKSAKVGDRIRFTVGGVVVANEMITLTGVDPVVIHSDSGASRSASRSKSGKRHSEKLANADLSAREASPAAQSPAGDVRDATHSAKRKKTH
ncbi:hypothetical protein T492DRAFT_936167 [Pavlovales sp. CCMP2436]|nr:hypothetical protein T492DRAFT_936167 [Pavlovales sp. CCMP2436]|mmetsp:Transcript_3079/g.7559  ORF Transcript_3079/g.7559 Transcript_3079/m.7559 type:complete len:212 (-) Transcript_3079:137-772(-)